MITRIAFMKKPAKRSLGVDIGSSSIRLLELSRQGDDYRVETCLSETLPAASSQHDNRSVIGENIARLVKLSGAVLEPATVAINNAAIKTKLFNLPTGLSEHEIETYAGIEAERAWSRPPNEILFDYFVMPGSTETSDQAGMNVLLVACLRKEFDGYREMLAPAGLKPVIIDVESYAIQKSLIRLQAKETEDRAIALLDIGSRRSTFNLCMRDRVLFYKEQPLAGQQLTEKIQDYYGMTLEHAEQGKCRNHLKDDYQEQVLLPFLEVLVQQIRICWQLARSASPFAEISRLILSGGSAALPGLIQLLEASFRVPVSLANPFAGMQYSGRLSDTELPDKYAFMLACGLALRGFDGSGD